PHKTLVATVMSNLALDRKMEELGGRVLRTQVGDRYVVEAMRAGGFTFGGEQSGHLIYLDHATSGDGMLAALKLLSVIRREEIKLSELSSVFTPYPQALLNILVKEKTPIEELPAVQAEIERIEKSLGREGRIFVRYSGTEKKARVLVEGPDKDVVQAYAQSVVDALSAAIGL
ncbi:phosphoglucosamine mutase, partial [Myxococcota bacterium]|nr:phosphoglucosamine mutase [Myxococcota bacterium]